MSRRPANGRRGGPWWVHGAVLLLLAAVGGWVTMADSASGGLLQGVVTYGYWFAYGVLALITSLMLAGFQAVFKHRRPWLALGLTYLIPFLAFQAFVVRERIRGWQYEARRARQRQVLLDRCIEIDAWEIVPGAGGGCDLRMALRSQTPAVIELRPGYRHWYGSQSVHRLPGSGVVRLRRPLDLVRPSADSGPLARPETPCDAFDFRAFRFTFRCGNLATVIYRSPGDPTADHMQANAARAVRPLPTSVNEAGGV